MYEIRQEISSKFSTLESEIRKSKSKIAQPMRPVVAILIYYLIIIYS